ncbi:MAG: hypothetical protein U9N04_02395 [Patescibacteria group bacterium]|nr:hypothetical protein [Patescibacteria group bacterium]
MQITIINDCFDQNAKLRQVTRTGSLFKNCSVNCFGVKSDLEAGGFLVDAIDAFDGRAGVIIVNVAPRNKKAEKWKNGTPFGFFRNKKTLVISSVDGLVLSLAKKLGVVKNFYLLDISEVLALINEKELNQSVKQRVINSQFRSFDFLPRVANWIIKKKNIPFEKYDLSEISASPNAVWFVDNFGNIKTTLLKKEITLDAKSKTTLKIAGKSIRLNFYPMLGNIPNKKAGLIVGSSGIGESRFLEIISRGGNASRELGIK